MGILSTKHFIGLEDANKKDINVTRNQSAYSLADLLFGSGTSKNKKPIEFALGEERLIDSFFDPTAYVLDEGVLYLSGYSFAFGLSEKLHISSKWFDYFWGNFNIRPKYMLMHKGNWEKESALAIGAHFHTYWRPDKVTFRSGEVEIVNESWNNGNSVETKETKYYGGYFPIGATVKAEENYYNDDDRPVSYTHLTLPTNREV